MSESNLLCIILSLGLIKHSSFQLGKQTFLRLQNFYIGLRKKQLKHKRINENYYAWKYVLVKLEALP